MWIPTYSEKVLINRMTRKGATLLDLFRATKIDKARLTRFLKAGSYAPVGEFVGGHEGWVITWYKVDEMCECGRAPVLMLPVATLSSYKTSGYYMADMPLCMGCYFDLREDEPTQTPKALLYGI